MSNNWDIICIGAGSTGLPLAIKAAEKGAKVLQIEADNRIGGTLFWSSGQIAAAGTNLQKRHGIEDSPDEHYEDAQHVANQQIDPTVLRLFVDNAADTINWLEDIGFKPAEETPVAGEAHEAYSTRRYLWGENQAISILDVMKPLHEQLVKEKKIDLRLEHRFKELIMDKAGAAIGIKVETKEGIKEFFGENIVLASGGYAASKEVWNELNPEIPLASRCNPFSRGDGIIAAKKHGAIVDGAEKYLCTFAGWLNDPQDPTSGEFLLLSPKARNVWEVFVNSEGKRFMQEDHQSIDYRERALLKQPGMEMNIIFDSAILQNASPLTLLDNEEYRNKFGNHPTFVKASSINDLALKLGVPQKNLEQTINDYNKSVEEKNDKEWNKYFLIRKIEKAPFYAVKAMGITVLGPSGLAVDSNLQVLKKDGSRIQNLYAGGEILGFGRTSGNAFVGGLSLTPALTFGKILGEKILSW
ncbi:MAG: FAD-dependent oxidoreductase [Pseudomonadota bacterium]|nr:FAD-dependent oxidoreductase [Pseudomonadota bacterium]